MWEEEEQLFLCVMMQKEAGTRRRQEGKKEGSVGRKGEERNRPVLRREVSVRVVLGGAPLHLHVLIHRTLVSRDRYDNEIDEERMAEQCASGVGTVLLHGH
jgi:hypothetical protein